MNVDVMATQTDREKAVSDRMAVDIGGTFTDLAHIDGKTGILRMAKVPTTPSDRTIGVFDSLREDGVDLAEVSSFIHGTTTATNVVVERRGARVGLLTTRGFRDTLEIMRINREFHYDLQWSKPMPMVPRVLRYEVTERIDYRGRIVTPLDVEDVRAAVAQMRDAGVESIALCFLFSFVNSAHEEQARQIVTELWPEVPLSVSVDILPEIREYERTSTVVVDAFVKPVMEGYFQGLESGLKAKGLKYPISIIGSSGGILPIEEASRAPIKTVHSGPAGGVIGAAYLGKLAGYENLLAIDVGGTSFEVSLIEGGEPRRTTEAMIEWGIPLRVQQIDVNSIGAGGGSIASIDGGGLLQVGPESAGAEPGPACYAHGGERATVTDAFVAAGWVDPSYFLGGHVRLDAQLARDAIDKDVAVPLGMDTSEAAIGVLRVVLASMVGAMQVVSTQRGYDPRDYTLMAYGGAGPVVATELARELSIGRVVIPRFPGAFCAVGGACGGCPIRFRPQLPEAC